MPKRRGNGDGGVSYREGRKLPWEARTTSTENRKVIYKYFGTKDEALVWLRSINSSIDANTFIAPNKVTLNDWIQNWLNIYVKPTVRLKTYEGYADIARLHICPFLGSYQLQSIMPADIQTLLNQKAASGLSKRTLQYIVSTLRPALKQAVLDGLIIRNPAEAVKLPRGLKPSTPKRALSRDDVRKLLIETEANQKLDLAIRVLLETGMRIGELLALSWDDVNFNTGTISVSKSLSSTKSEGRIITSPKTASSIRTIPLTSSLVHKLMQWKANQAEERLLIGEDYLKSDAVFTMLFGNRMRQEWLSDNLRKAANKAGVTGCSPHILRHTFASRLMESGVDIKTAQELLGHSSSRMIIEIYAHSSEDQKRKAVELIGIS